MTAMTSTFTMGKDTRLGTTRQTNPAQNPRRCSVTLPDMATDSSDRTGGLTVTEAADQLGISVEAVRQRIKRNTLRHTKREGTVYVHLESDRTRPTTDRQVDRTTEHGGLLDALREQVASLQQQLDRAEERDRENRRLLAAALERIPPQLEAPREGPTEPPASPVTDSQPGPSSTVRGEEKRAPQRPWWSRWFGG